MNDTQIRLECLKIMASQGKENILLLAKAAYEFVTASEKPAVTKTNEN